MPSPYWEAQTEPWQQGMRNISSAFIMAPRMNAMAANLRAQEALRQQQMLEAAQRTQLVGAQTGLVGAQTGEADARTAELAKKGALVEALQSTAPAALRAMAAGNTNDPSIDQFTGAATALTGENKGDIMEVFRKGMATMLGAGGNVRKAAEVANPVSVVNNRTDNAQKLAAASGYETDTTTETTPGSKTVEGVPGVPATPGGVFGIGAKPAIAPVPAIPGKPTVTVRKTKKVPTGAVSDLAAALLGNGTMPATANTDTDTETGDDSAGTDADAVPAAAGPAAGQPVAAPAGTPPSQPVPGSPTAGLPKFNAPEDVRMAYQTGKLDRATAKQILQNQFGYLSN